MSNLELAKDELLELAELREIYVVINTPGWNRLKKMMQSLVDEAQEDMLSAVYATNEIKAAFLTRWQQREAMMRAVTFYVESCEQRRKLILEEIAERNNERQQEKELYAFMEN